MCAEDFAVQLIAFDVGDDFVVEADLVQVSATVIQVVDLSTVRGVLVSGFLNLVVIAGEGANQPSQYISFGFGLDYSSFG